MPREIFWEIHPTGSDDLDFGTAQRVRFRRPQLIKVEDIVSVFRERLEQLWLAHSVIINEGEVEKGEKKEPDPVFEDEEVFSIKKIYSFPLKIITGSKYSFFSIIHNVPLKEKPVMGACTWLDFTQPLTSVELKISIDWWDPVPLKKKNEIQRQREIANSLYWFFQRWINQGELVEQLSHKYDLKPQFDPSWTDCVIEDQCQECGKIYSSLPYKLNEVEIGKVSKNYCHCRWKKDYRYPDTIERKFKIIGAYPISPEEAQVALSEGALMADSAFG